MRKISGSFAFIYIGMSLFHCNLDTESKVDLEFNALQGLLNNGSPVVFFAEEIDMEKTPDCGRATVSNNTGQQGGQQPGQQPIRSTTRQTNNNQQNQTFSIISTFNIKPGNETLNMRFNYDKRQVRGPINPQQGFSLTGGAFGNTVTGRQGTVEWGQMGINLISNQSNQQLNFMQVSLDLVGSFVPGIGSAVPPNQCFTQDGVNCTSVQTNTQCFTTDNRTCLGDTAQAEGSVQVLIKGTIRCLAPDVL